MYGDNCKRFCGAALPWLANRRVPVEIRMVSIPGPHCTTGISLLFPILLFFNLFFSELGGSGGVVAGAAGVVHDSG